MINAAGDLVGCNHTQFLTFAIITSSVFMNMNWPSYTFFAVHERWWLDAKNGFKFTKYILICNIVTSVVFMDMSWPSYFFLQYATQVVTRREKWLLIIKYLLIYRTTGPKAGMSLVGHADANRHALLNTRKLPVYSTCRLCQQTQTLNLLVVVQGQCTMGCAADESGMEGGFSAP